MGASALKSVALAVAPARLVRSIPNQRSSFPLRYSSSSGRSRRPPSPEVTCLIAWREKTQQWPWPPIFKPRYFAPIACAQSSMTLGRNPNLLKQDSTTASTLSRSTGVPPQCTKRMTLVVGLSFRSRSSKSMFAVPGFTSTHFNLSPLASAGQLVAVQVSGLVSTSSTPAFQPGHWCAWLGRSKSRNARWVAEVQLLVVRTRGFLKKSLRSASKDSTWGPCVM
mmetsp:Transcript_887/g.1923  ORF Transcript_887/g.1923 Transcript_887/m.1923 type:complete len:223 (+) Transcript_887:818-1486(+)